MSPRSTLLAASFAAMAAMALPLAGAGNAAEPKVEIGVLECKVAGGVGFIFKCEKNRIQHENTCQSKGFAQRAGSIQRDRSAQRCRHW